jgi:hypothetical protein
MRTTRIAAGLLAAALAGFSAPAAAQSAGPLALLVPASARSAALGNAWTAGRDEYVLFSNPALVNPTSWFGATYAAYGNDAFGLSTAAAANIGPANFAWGVQYMSFSTPRTSVAYPYAPAALTRPGDADVSSILAVASGNATWKGFRIGVSAKFAQDITAHESAASGLLVTPQRGDAIVFDLGTSHPLWTGVAGFSLQNIGQPYTMGAQRVSVPTEASMGWSTTRAWDALDYGFFTQVTGRRDKWVGAAGGMEVGWSWIEGCSITGRVGARRTETNDEKPVGLGGSLNIDRLGIDYGVNFFTDNKAVHRLTLRWR